MKRSQMFTVAIVTGGLIAFAELPSRAQHSSGGTPSGVTEGTGSGSGSGMDSGSSGASMGNVGSGSEMGGNQGSGNQAQQKHPDTPKQAGSQGQQGMKGSGSPMEHDKSSNDKLI